MAGASHQGDPNAPEPRRSLRGRQDAEPQLPARGTPPLQPEPCRSLRRRQDAEPGSHSPSSQPLAGPQRRDPPPQQQGELLEAASRGAQVPAGL